MSMTIQTSLFDAAPQITLGSLPAGLVRQELGREAWVDLLPGWMSGADALFDTLLSEVDWVEERRQMYERVVLVPRLLRFYSEDEELPDPALTRARNALNEHYGAELGERFVTAGMCLYRDGRDSPGTVTPSGEANRQTRWSRSSRSAHRGISCCVRAEAGSPSSIRLAMVICW